jgi:hypothetical protein
VLRVALAVSAALPAASRYRPYGWRAMTPTPPTTSSTKQTIGSTTGTAKLLIVRRGSRAPRPPQGGRRVVEPTAGTTRTAIPGRTGGP